MFGREIEDEIRFGIDDISRRGGAGGEGGSGGGPWPLAGGRNGGSGGRGGRGAGADPFSLLFAWIDALAGLAGIVLALLRRI